MRRAGIGASLIALLATGAAAQQVPLTARFDWFDYRGSNPGDMAGPLEPGIYRNPILGGFYPDPSVTRVGDDYYLVTSTFGYFPGIPVFHSRDLVHWTQIGNAIDRPDQLDFKQLGLSRGVFAPSIQARDGVFYILNTCVDCGGNFVITATNPAGPWSDPVWLPDLEGGIDPSLFFDEDGRSWIVNNGPPAGTPQYEGHRAIWVQQFDLKALKTVGPRTLLVNGGVDIAKKPVWIEGPHILKKDGWYYLICAEGGTAEGHSQVALRSRSVTGPYAPDPANPILTQRDLQRERPDPITSAGHAQLVQTPQGEWWVTFLAVRPYQGDFYNTGRETYLLPVRWADGWPSITEPGQEIPRFVRKMDSAGAPAPKIPTSGPFAIRDEFDGTALPPYWMMLRNPRTRWYALERGALVLTARPVGLGDNGNPSFLARRQQHSNAVAETVVRFAPRGEGDRAGLAVLQNDDYWLAIDVEQHDGAPVIAMRARSGPDEPKDGRVTYAPQPLGAPGAPVHLRIEAQGRSYSLSWGREAGPVGAVVWIPLARVDGSFLSTKTAGGFVGAVFGPFAESGK